LVTYEHNTAADDGLEERLRLIERELLWRGLQSVPYGRWSLFQHNQSVVSLLEDWGQAAHLQLAASVQGIYHEEVSRRLTVPLTRDLVRNLVGVEAERLVYLSGVCDRSLINAPLSSGSVFSSPIGVFSAAIDRAQDVSGSVISELIVLRSAISAEEGTADGKPARWLSDVSTAASRIKSQSPEIPAALRACAEAAVTGDAENNLLDAYLAFDAHDVPNSAMLRKKLQETAETVPIVGEPFILLGLALLSKGDSEVAADFGRRAKLQLAAWGTSWDKRLTGISWLALAQFLERSLLCTGKDFALLRDQVSRILSAARGCPEIIYARLDALQLLGEPRLEPPMPELPEHDIAAELEGYSDFDVLPPRFSHYVAALRENNTRKLLDFYPGLTSRPFWDTLEFEICTTMRHLALDIKGEFARLETSQFVPNDGIEAPPGSVVYPLVVRGKKTPIDPTKCPVTMRLLDGSASIGTSYFCRIPADIRIPARRAPSNMLLRCYFGLTVKDRPQIIVDGLAEVMREERALIFDGSYLHEERNPGDHDIVLLVTEVWHPDLTTDEVQLLEGLNRLVDAEVAQTLRLSLEHGATTSDSP
jgi:aspartate beta-hydroxylase